MSTAAILPLLGLFNQLLRQATSKRYYTSLQVTICYTRCFANPPPHVLKVLQTELPVGLRVTPGRPKLQSTLNSVVDHAQPGEGTALMEVSNAVRESGKYDVWADGTVQTAKAKASP